VASTETHLRVLRLLQANPHLTQRELADELGVSLGKVNYCLKALLVKGLIKMQNFSKSRNKLGYAFTADAVGSRRQGAVDCRVPAHKDGRVRALKHEIEQLRVEHRAAALKEGSR
jgi:EPS-associated MarR family transcriptional regulator